MNSAAHLKTSVEDDNRSVVVFTFKHFASFYLIPSHMYMHACQRNLIRFASVNLQFSPACLFASVFIATFDLHRCRLKFKLVFLFFAEILSPELEKKIQSLSCRTKHAVKSALANNNTEFTAFKAIEI